MCIPKLVKQHKIVVVRSNNEDGFILLQKILQMKNTEMNGLVQEWLQTTPTLDGIIRTSM